MKQITGQRMQARQMVIIALGALGAVLGCMLGCAFVLMEAGNALEHAARAATAHENAALAEASDALEAMQDARSGYCSDREIAGFRQLVFGSVYLKDAGRIRGGKIECSAISGHPARAIGPFQADFRLQDGTLAYHNLSPLRVPGLSRAALRQGSAYVVFGLLPAAASGSIPTRLAVAMQAGDGGQAKPAAAAALSGDPPYRTREGSGWTGNTLHVTRCSDPAFSCVTATTTVPEAIRGEAAAVSLFGLAGGVAGILFGMGFPFSSLRDRDLGRQLRRALENDKLEVRYQPIVSLETRQIVGAEALARWSDARGNAVDPEVFVKIAEEQGFEGMITKAVLKRVLRDFAATLRSRPDFRVSINVGAPDLVEPSFLPMLGRALEKARVQPQSLVVEITERSAANGEAAKETIRLLRHCGHSIHIDDFGSGFSNLDRLLYLYADTIKIDKAFTRTIDTESVAAVILPHIMTIARSLNLEVIVEGVEISRQADYFLPGRQKIYGQGWLFGRPMTAEELLLKLEDGAAQAEERELVEPAPAGLRAARTLTA